MSLQRRFNAQFRNLAQFFYLLKFPAWLESVRLRVTLSVVVVLISVLYIGSLSQASATGYQIQELEKTTANLIAENQKLEIAVIEQRSLSSIQQRLAGMRMVPASDIKYQLVAVPKTVAKK